MRRGQLPAARACFTRHEPRPTCDPSSRPGAYQSATGAGFLGGANRLVFERVPFLARSTDVGYSRGPKATHNLCFPFKIFPQLRAAQGPTL